MKLSALLLLTVATLAAAGANAETPSKKRLSKTKPGANWLMNDYMSCKQVKKNALAKERSELSCDEKASLHFCSILEPLPKDVQNNIALELYCNFLAGEQPENSAQDLDITKAAEKAGCFEGGDQRAALNEKYKNKPDELDALENFTTSFFDAEDNCYKPDSDAKKEAKAEEKPAPQAEPVEELKPAAGTKSKKAKAKKEPSPEVIENEDEAAEAPADEAEH